MATVSWREAGKTAVLAAALLVSATGAEAQVGLKSHEARVALIARVPAGATLRAVSAARVVRLGGSVSEATITVRLSSNNGYRLLVYGTAGALEGIRGTTRRIWVQGVDGRFHELREGTQVTVAENQSQASEWHRDIVYRIEDSGTPLETVALPVRYDLVVQPVM